MELWVGVLKVVVDWHIVETHFIGVRGTDNSVSAIALVDTSHIALVARHVEAWDMVRVATGPAI